MSHGPPHLTPDFHLPPEANQRSRSPRAEVPSSKPAGAPKQRRGRSTSVDAKANRTPSGGKRVHSRPRRPGSKEPPKRKQPVYVEPKHQPARSHAPKLGDDVLKSIPAVARKSGTLVDTNENGVSSPRYSPPRHISIPRSKPDLSVAAGSSRRPSAPGAAASRQHDEFSSLHSADGSRTQHPEEQQQPAAPQQQPPSQPEDDIRWVSPQDEHPQERKERERREREAQEEAQMRWVSPQDEHPHERREREQREREEQEEAKRKQEEEEEEEKRQQQEQQLRDQELLAQRAQEEREQNPPPAPRQNTLEPQPAHEVQQGPSEEMAAADAEPSGPLEQQQPVSQAAAEAETPSAEAVEADGRQEPPPASVDPPSQQLEVQQQREQQEQKRQQQIEEKPVQRKEKPAPAPTEPRRHPSPSASRQFTLSPSRSRQVGEMRCLDVVVDNSRNGAVPLVGIVHSPSGKRSVAVRASIAVDNIDYVRLERQRLAEKDQQVASDSDVVGPCGQFEAMLEEEIQGAMASAWFDDETAQTDDVSIAVDFGAGPVRQLHLSAPSELEAPAEVLSTEFELKILVEVALPAKTTAGSSSASAAMRQYLLQPAALLASLTFLKSSLPSVLLPSADGTTSRPRIAVQDTSVNGEAILASRRGSVVNNSGSVTHAAQASVQARQPIPFEINTTPIRSAESSSPTTPIGQHTPPAVPNGHSSGSAAAPYAGSFFSQIQNLTRKAPAHAASQPQQQGSSRRDPVPSSVSSYANHAVDIESDDEEVLAAPAWTGAPQRSSLSPAPTFTPVAMSPFSAALRQARVQANSSNSSTVSSAPASQPFVSPKPQDDPRVASAAETPADGEDIPTPRDNSPARSDLRMEASIGTPPPEHPVPATKDTAQEAPKAAEPTNRVDTQPPTPTQPQQEPPAKETEADEEQETSSKPESAPTQHHVPADKVAKSSEVDVVDQEPASKQPQAPADVFEGRLSLSIVIPVLPRAECSEELAAALVDSTRILLGRSVSAYASSKDIVRIAVASGDEGMVRIDVIIRLEPRHEVVAAFALSNFLRAENRSSRVDPPLAPLVATLVGAGIVADSALTRAHKVLNAGHCFVNGVLLQGGAAVDTGDESAHGSDSRSHSTIQQPDTDAPPTTTRIVATFPGISVGMAREVIECDADRYDSEREEYTSSRSGRRKPAPLFSVNSWLDAAASDLESALGALVSADSGVRVRFAVDPLEANGDPRALSAPIRVDALLEPVAQEESPLIVRTVAEYMRGRHAFKSFLKLFRAAVLRVIDGEFELDTTGWHSRSRRNSGEGDEEPKHPLASAGVDGLDPTLSFVNGAPLEATLLENTPRRSRMRDRKASSPYRKSSQGTAGTPTSPSRRESTRRRQKEPEFQDEHADRYGSGVSSSAEEEERQRKKPSNRAPAETARQQQRPQAPTRLPAAKEGDVDFSPPSDRNKVPPRRTSPGTRPSAEDARGTSHTSMQQDAPKLTVSGTDGTRRVVVSGGGPSQPPPRPGMGSSSRGPRPSGGGNTFVVIGGNEAMRQLSPHRSHTVGGLGAGSSNNASRSANQSRSASQRPDASQDYGDEDATVEYVVNSWAERDVRTTTWTTTTL